MASPTSAALATSDEARGRVEAEIAAWAGSAQGRPLYEKYRDRRAYNHEICHRLAAAGVPPVAAAVLRLGRWGQSGSVAEDVAIWYAGLAQRLADQESAIPLPVRRQANDLVESLWKLAGADVDSRLVEPLRQELAGRDQQLTESRQQAHTLGEQLAAANREVERLQGDLAVTGTALADQRRRADAAEHALAESKLKYSRELATLREKHSADVAELNERHGRDTTQLRQQLDAEVARSNGERTALLHRVDQAQVEARQALAKGEEAQAALQRALSDLGDAKAAAAKAAGELAMSRNVGERLTQELAEAAAASADAGRSGVNVFLSQMRGYGLRMVRDFSSPKKLTRPDWMAEQDWDSYVLTLIGGAGEAAQLRLLQELAEKAKPRKSAKK